MRELNYEYYCLRCKHFDEDYGVCRKFNENVIEYPDKFKKKCNSKYFIESVSHFIDENTRKYKSEFYEYDFSDKIKTSKDGSYLTSRIKLHNITPKQFLIIASDIIEFFKWKILYIKKKEINAKTSLVNNFCSFIITLRKNNVKIVCRKSELIYHFEWYKENIEMFLEKYYEVIEVKNYEVLSEKRDFNIFDINEVNEYVKQLIKYNKELEFSLSKNYITTGLIITNVLIFLLILSFDSIYQTENEKGLINWGANVKRLTESGQWWRVLTAVFLHGHLFHLLFNMIALFWIGNKIEPSIGHFRFLVFYLIMGIVASHCGIYFYGEDEIIIGASGAILGLFGIYFALLNSSLYHRKSRKVIRRDLLIFLIYVVLSSFKSGIDLAGHVGGLISGVIIGYIIVLTSKNEHILNEINDF